MLLFFMHGNLERDTKRIMPAILMISLMLMSTQLLVLLDSGENIEQADTPEISKRSAYQQLEQLSGPVQGEGQNQPASTNPFSEAPFRDPFYHDPASMYGKVSDPSALALDPMYGFYLEETNTEDHDNDGIPDHLDDDDDGDGIPDDEEDSGIL